MCIYRCPIYYPTKQYMSNKTTEKDVGGGSLTTFGHGDGTTISDVHPDILHTHILTRLDGPTLASTSCASSQLRALSTEENLWQKICHHTWPSTGDPRVRGLISAFPKGHRSFYSDSFPAPDYRRHLHLNRRRPLPPANIFSAVDIHYQNRLIVSKVQETETASDLLSPFQIELVGLNETAPIPVEMDIRTKKCLSNLEENLTLTWILIDPTRTRAANISSQRPVLIKRNWLTHDVELRYVTVLSSDKRSELVQCTVVVTSGGGGLMVREVSLHVEDMEGNKLGWIILQEAVEGGRRRIAEKGEERERYEEWWRGERERRERKRRREKRREMMICLMLVVTIFVILLSFGGFVVIKLLRLLQKGSRLCIFRSFVV